MWIIGSVSLRYVGQWSFGSAVYADEQSKFICDPGATEVGVKSRCFNMFSPISAHRLWGVQTIGQGLTIRYHSSLVFF